MHARAQCTTTAGLGKDLHFYVKIKNTVFSNIGADKYAYVPGDCGFSLALLDVCDSVCEISSVVRPVAWWSLQLIASADFVPRRYAAPTITPNTLHFLNQSSNNAIIGSTTQGEQVFMTGTNCKQIVMMLQFTLAVFADFDVVSFLFAQSGRSSSFRCGTARPQTRTSSSAS